MENTKRTIRASVHHTARRRCCRNIWGSIISFFVVLIKNNFTFYYPFKKFIKLRNSISTLAISIDCSTPNRRGNYPGNINACIIPRYRYTVYASTPRTKYTLHLDYLIKIPAIGQNESHVPTKSP